MEWLTDPQAWVALATLTLLEMVLGIDNIIFISILASRLPERTQAGARKIGLGLAMFSRIALLGSLAWLSHLTSVLFSIAEHHVTARDLILFLGGLFLLGKATLEIHHSLEGVDERRKRDLSASFGLVLAQIVMLDVVFSLDSVITAIGMADHLAVMIIAIVIAVAVMMAAMDPLSTFVEEHPTVKMLALSFLLLVGMSLIAEGFGQHIPKGYLYFAMAFSNFVEMLNLRILKRIGHDPVRLRRPILRKDGKSTG